MECECAYVKKEAVVRGALHLMFLPSTVVPLVGCGVASAIAPRAEPGDAELTRAETRSR